MNSKKEKHIEGPSSVEVDLNEEGHNERGITSEISTSPYYQAGGACKMPDGSRRVEVDGSQKIVSGSELKDEFHISEELFESIQRNKPVSIVNFDLTFDSLVFPEDVYPRKNCAWQFPYKTADGADVGQNGDLNKYNTEHFIDCISWYAWVKNERGRNILTINTDDGPYPYDYQPEIPKEPGWKDDILNLEPECPETPDVAYSESGPDTIPPPAHDQGAEVEPSGFVTSLLDISSPIPTVKALPAFLHLATKVVDGINDLLKESQSHFYLTRTTKFFPLEGMMTQNTL